MQVIRPTVTTNISWSPDEKSIYLIELNRDQNHAVLCQYDATTGKRYWASCWKKRTPSM